MIILNTVKTNISGCCFFSFHNLMNPSKSIVVTKIALTPWFDVTVPDSLLFPFGVCVHDTLLVGSFPHQLLANEKETSFEKL